MAEAARGGGDGQCGDVAVPREVVRLQASCFEGGVGFDGGGIGRGLEFAEDCGWVVRLVGVLVGRVGR